MAETISIDFGPVLRAIGSVEARVDSVSREVGAARADISTTQSELQELRRRFDEFVDQAVRTANIQRSETKLSGLKDDLDRAYGHYNVVRRTSIGILQAFDIGNVSGRTVTQVSEELMIQTPRYWLAPALVALAAWSKGDEALSKLSVDEAFSRDPRKTSLFFALVLRRQGRSDLAARWLHHYLLGLDPAMLTREFAIVFEAAAQDAFGVAGTQAASDQLGVWLEHLRGDQKVVDHQVATWRAFLQVLSLRIHADDFPNLRALCPEWSELAWLIEQSSTLPEAITHFEQIKRQIAVPRSDVVDLLDDVLEQLVTEYDEEELPLRREIAFHEAVIAEEGDLDRARVRAEVHVEALEQTTDALSMQTMLASDPDVLGASVKSQQIAIGSSRTDIETAIAQHTRDYRERVPADVTISLAAGHTGFAQTFGFAGWATKTSVPEAQAIASLREKWEETFAAYLEAQKVKTTKYIVAGAISFVIALLLLVAGAWPMTLIIVLGGGAIIGGLYYAALRRSRANIANLEATREQAVELSVQMLRSATSEYLDIGEYYDDLDRREAELLALIRTWPVGAKGKAA